MIEKLLKFQTFFFLSLTVTLLAWSHAGMAAPAASRSSSQLSGLRITADTISRDYETKTISLEGGVEIAFEDQVLKCDKASVDMRKETILATGHVTLATTDTVLEGSQLTYNYRTKLGKIENGVLQSGQVAFEGKRIEKTGENTYFAEDARYTACKTCPPAWSFSGKEIDAELGGYAYIKYPVLRVSNFPIFILPRILIPLKSARQSGFLVPSLDYSKKGGAALEQTYFWAMSQSQDMTFGLKKYERRGLKYSAEYRYVLARGSGGTFKGSYINDLAYTKDGQASSQLDTIPRGFFLYRHQFELPNNFTQRVNLNFVTDLRYPRDFSEDMPGHGDPALENSASITQNTDTQHRSIEADYYINLLKDEDAATMKGDALSRNDDAVHRWPEIRYSVMEQELLNTNLFYKLDMDYTHFARRDFGYDEVATSGCEFGNPKCATTVRDGSFDPTQDLIRTGHRLIVTPTVSYPFHIGPYFDVLPSITYNESQYRFTPAPDPNPTGFERSAASRFLQTDLAVRTVLSAVYGKDDGKSDRIKHEIQPEVIYSHIPWAERPEHPFFGNFEDQPYSRSFESVSTEDFFGDSGLQFDYRDRFFAKRLVTFGLANNWVRKHHTPSGAVYQKLATFKVRQSFDFNEADRDDPSHKPYPWSAVNALLDMRFNRFETHTTADYYPYAKVTNWSSRVRFKTLTTNYLELTYSQKYYIDEDNQTSSETQKLGTGVGFRSKYFDLNGIAYFDVSTADHFEEIPKRLEGWEYTALFKPPGDCWSIKLGHKKTLGADTVFKFSFNFEFGGA